VPAAYDRKAALYDALVALGLLCAAAGGIAAQEPARSRDPCHAADMEPGNR
jgi:hypothetical protein